MALERVGVKLIEKKMVEAWLRWFEFLTVKTTYNLYDFSLTLFYQ